MKSNKKLKVLISICTTKLVAMLGIMWVIFFVLSLNYSSRIDWIFALLTVLLLLGFLVLLAIVLYLVKQREETKGEKNESSKKMKILTILCVSLLTIWVAIFIALFLMHRPEELPPYMGTGGPMNNRPSWEEILVLLRFFIPIIIIILLMVITFLLIKKRKIKGRK
ncbi:MAG: hypothetical protein FWE16_00530 [Firmicutes bacterium]|nr:hypothetical protein [Bacillota bacterium]